MGLIRGARIAIAATGIVCITVIAAGAEQSILERPVPQFSVYDVRMQQAAADLATQVPFRLGFESAETAQTPFPPTAPWVRVQVRQTNVKAALDALVKADPRYVWRLDGDFINMMPKVAETDQNYYMNARVERFQVSAAPLVTCIKMLLGIPSIAKYNPVMPSLGIAAGGNPAAYPPISLTEQDVTWRHLMNDIARQAGEGWGWVSWQTATPDRPHPQSVVEFIMTYGFAGGRPPQRARPKMIPFRQTMEASGATVTWAGRQGVAQARFQGHLIQVQVGSIAAFLDARAVNLVVPPDLREGRLLVPEDLLLSIRVFEPGLLKPVPKT
jgi:hypothetical protein